MSRNNTEYTAPAGSRPPSPSLSRASSWSDTSATGPPAAVRAANDPLAVETVPLPAARPDARQIYKGYTFVFSTDAYHDETRVYRRNGHVSNSIRYLKPLVVGHRIDHLPPLKLPFYLVAISWTDSEGKERMTSRVEICQAWQVGFNALLYYGSFTEEMGHELSEHERSWCKEQFSQWNDLFTELDEVLGRISECERTRQIPTLVDPPQDTSTLANPFNRTSSETPLESIRSTFLAATAEIARRRALQATSPHPEITTMERRLSPWDPCRGHAVIDATTWTVERVNQTARGGRSRSDTAGSQSGLDETQHDPC